VSPDAMDMGGIEERKESQREASFTEAPLFIFLGLLSLSLKLGMNNGNLSTSVY